MNPCVMRRTGYRNMSVPPLSRVSVERATLPGRMIPARLPASLCRPDLYARYGAGAALVLLEAWRAGRIRRVLQAPNVEATCVSRAAEPSSTADLTALLDRAITDAGIPPRPAVFVAMDPGPKPPTIPPDACELAFALLCRRSGPLYLPTRPYQPSLVLPGSLALFVPEDA